MLLNNDINKIVQIREFHCKINLEIKYYSSKKGQLKGIKILENNIPIYLVEFINCNRIWALRQEFVFL